MFTANLSVKPPFEAAISDHQWQ